MIRLLPLLLLATPTFCTVFQSCHRAPAPVFMQSGDCSDNCVVTAGGYVTHYVFFQPHHAVTAMTAIERTGNTTILNDTNVCESLVIGSCPLPPRRIVAYPYTTYVPLSPVGYVNATFELLDQDHNVIACYSVIATVVSPSASRRRFN